MRYNHLKIKFHWKKSTAALLAALGITLTSVSGVSAAKTPHRDIPVDVMVNNHYIGTDAPAYIENGTTYVPIRFVGEALQASVSWNQATNTATIKGSGSTIELPLNSRTAKVNGKPVTLSGPAHLRQDRTFVPVRFVAEHMGAAVHWDQTYYTAKISKPSVRVPGHLVQWDYTEDEIFWLARIIEAESKGEPVEGMVAVGNVILNRVASPDYPNSIYGVIFDTKYGVQYQPTANGTIYNTPSGDAVASAKRALRGENFAGPSLFFFNPRTASSNWISQNRPYYKTIANHAFYL